LDCIGKGGRIKLPNEKGQENTNQKRRERGGRREGKLG